MAKIDKPATTKISPPQKRSSTSKSKIPEVTSKPSPNEVKPIQFKIPAKLHQEIKMYSVEQGMTMTEFFIEIYKEYRSNHN